VLLAWLKESGVYDLLNGAAPSSAADLVPAVQSKEAESLALLQHLNTSAADVAKLKSALVLTWLKETGALDQLTKLPTSSLDTAALASSIHAASSPSSSSSFTSSSSSSSRSTTSETKFKLFPSLPKFSLPNLGLMSWMKSSPAPQKPKPSGAAWVKTTTQQSAVASQSASTQAEGKVKLFSDAFGKATKQAETLKASLKPAPAAHSARGAPVVNEAGPAPVAYSENQLCSALPAGSDARQGCYNSWVFKTQFAASGPSCALASDVQSCVNKWVAEQQRKRGALSSCATAAAENAQNCVNWWIELQMKAQLAKKATIDAASMGAAVPAEFESPDDSE